LIPTENDIEPKKYALSIGGMIAGHAA